MTDRTRRPGDPIRRYNPDELFDPRPLGFSSVVVAPSAPLVFVAGKLAADQHAPFERQVEEAFTHLQLALESGGARLASVVKITCLIVEADDERLGIVSAARRRHFGDHGPASTIIPVPRLAGEDALFEIDAIAVVETSASSDDHSPTSS